MKNISFTENIFIVFCLLTIKTEIISSEEIKSLFHQPPNDQSWPPSGDPGPDWPGHNEQLALMQPKTKVNVAYKKTFPTSIDFYKNYVEKNHPVVFHQVTNGPEFRQLKIGQISKSSRAAISRVEVSPNDGAAKEEKSLFDFMQTKIKETHYISAPLHKNYKDLLTLPQCLQCTRLVDLLVDTNHVIIEHPKSLAVQRNIHEMLSCQIDGEKELLLIDTKKQQGIQSILDINDPPHGQISSLGSHSVDFKKYPGVAQVTEFHISFLKPGDCIYIPAGWIYQSNVLSIDNSIDFRWEANIPWNPDSESSRGLTKRTLSSLNWKGEPGHKPVDALLDRQKKLVDRLTHLIDTCLSFPTLTLNFFLVKLVKDGQMLPDIQDWTMEFRARLEELFYTLDLTTDSVLDAKDLEQLSKLTKKDLTRLIGRLDDRIADLDDLMIDQQVDFSLFEEIPRTREEIIRLIGGEYRENKEEL